MLQICAGTNSAANGDSFWFLSAGILSRDAGICITVSFPPIVFCSSMDEAILQGKKIGAMADSVLFTAAEICIRIKIHVRSETTI